MNGSVLQFIAKCHPQDHWKVLEVGSMDVNGSPREVINCADYTGIDFRPGLGVDVVMKGEDLLQRWPECTFDLVLCCETLEHCEDWRGVLTASWAVLKADLRAGRRGCAAAAAIGDE